MRSLLTSTGNFDYTVLIWRMECNAPQNINFILLFDQADYDGMCQS